MTLVIPPKDQEVLTSSGHWRTRDGQLILSVPNKSGEGAHATTLRDARVLDLTPSVTTVINTVDKPMLDLWKVEKALEAYIQFPHMGKDYAIEQMRKISRDASDMGTAIHDAIQQGFKGTFRVPEYLSDILDGFWNWYEFTGFEMERVEHTFVNNDLGYNGTIDFEGTLNGEPVIVDWKTEDAETAQDFNFYTPEYPLQLAGYDVGVEEDRKRLTVKISRTKPGVIKTKVWMDKDGGWQGHNRRFNRAWLSLWDFWQASHAYYPGKYHGMKVVGE